MKIYVRESDNLSIQTLSLLFCENMVITPFLSLEDVSYEDWIIISQADGMDISALKNYHVIIYEKFFQEFYVRVYQEYYNNHDYYYLRNALQQAKDPEVTTLISGSSYGAFGIDLASMRNSVNLSSISQDLYYSTKLLYQACEHNKNIKNIVLCVGYYCFFSDLSLTKNEAELRRISKVYYPLLQDSHNCFVLPPKGDSYMQGNIVDFDRNINIYAEVDYRDGFFNERRPRGQCATVVWESVTKSWRELSLEEKEKAGKIRAGNHNKNIDHTASFYENISLFQEFVYYCNDRGINLLVAAMPASKQYLQYLIPDYKNTFYSVLDKMDGIIHLVDLVEDNSFDNNLDFNDTDHLSDSGAIKFSRMVSSILDNINS